MRLTRLTMIASISAVVGCTLVSGVDALSVVGDDDDDEAMDSGQVDVDMPDTSPPPPPPIVVDAEAYDAGEAGYINLAGDWTGSWNQDFTIVGGAATIQLTQDGASLSGSGEVKGGPCPRVGTVKGGFVAADAIAGTFTSTDGMLVLNLSATVSPEGKKLSARFQSVGICLPGAFGTAELIRP